MEDRPFRPLPPSDFHVGESVTLELLTVIDATSPRYRL